MEQTTTDLEAILGEGINYGKLAEAVKSGFEVQYKMKIEEEKL